MRRGAFSMAAVAILIAAMSGSTAQAGGISGYPEPSFTKTAANNSFWFQWTATTGVNNEASNGSPNYNYFMCIKTYVNNDVNNPAEDSSGTNGGPGSQNCTGYLRTSSSQPSTGTLGFHPFDTNTVLADNTLYEMCGNGFYWYVYYWRGDPTGCASTVIDRSAPSGAITLAGGAASTKNPSLAIRIDYNDAISPPWPGVNGQSFTWGCLARGGNCATPATAGNGWSWHQGCSNPAARLRITYMTCAWDLAAQPDGSYHYCAIQSDSGVPDNPNGSNQFIATADQANRSAIACDSTVLDRTAPTVTVSASNTNVTTGNLVTFTAGATDAGSGVSGSYSWTFGDNTAGASGANTSHTYTQPGTYVAKVTTTDNAGNAGEATKTITVTGPPAGGGDGGGTTTTPTTTTTTTTSTTPTNTTTTPTTTTSTTTNTNTTTTTTSTNTTNTNTTTSGSSTNTNSGITETTSTAVQQEIKQNSAGGTRQQSLGSVLGVLVPRSIRMAKKPGVLIGLTASKPGRVSIKLTRKGKTLAAKAANLGRAGVYTMRMAVSPKLRLGAYRLQVTFKPAAGGTFTKSFPLTVKGAKKATARSSSTRATVIAPRRPVTRAARYDRTEDRRRRGAPSVRPVSINGR